jgi:hypothetical protein
MTRRTTVIQPSTTTNALYTLPNQPFKRRIISASIYGFVIGGAYHTCFPELKINDVEGNVLAALTPLIDMGSFFGGTNFNFFFSNLGGSNYTFTPPPSPGVPPIVLVPITIPENLCVPASNLFTITIWGSLPADTLPNLVFVTEDDDDDLIY